MTRGVAERWGQNIRDRRQALGMTQAAVGARVSCCRAAVAQWESGRRSPGPPERVALAQALDIEEGALFPLCASDVRPLIAAARRACSAATLTDVRAALADLAAAVAPFEHDNPQERRSNAALATA